MPSARELLIQRTLKYNAQVFKSFQSIKGGLVSIKVDINKETLYCTYCIALHCLPYQDRNTMCSKVTLLQLGWRLIRHIGINDPDLKIHESASLEIEIHHGQVKFAS